MLSGMWVLPRPGVQPMSPALTGRFLATGPQRKSPSLSFYCSFFYLDHKDIYFIFKDVSNLNIFVILSVKGKGGRIL